MYVFNRVGLFWNIYLRPKQELALNLYQYNTPLNAFQKPLATTQTIV